jgi:hypothetical protein
MLVYCRTAECVDRQPTLSAALLEQVNVENALFDVREQSHNMRRNMQYNRVNSLEHFAPDNMTQPRALPSLQAGGCNLNMQALLRSMPVTSATPLAHAT